MLATVVCLGGCLLAYTWIHLEVRRTGYRIDRLERSLADLEREERELRLQASHLGSPGMVENRAVSELGMQPPDLKQVVFWEELQ